jgi:putative RecB family exonuclease
VSFAPPLTLSPSKLDRFTHCALAFRLSYIDHLPEPSTIQQVRGTLVHRALQLLHAVEPAEERTPERAQLCLDAAWSELSVDAELLGLGLDAEGSADLLRQSARLLERYFTLEDPREVQSIGLELALAAGLDGVQVRGIIDRLDLLRSGELVIVDYKTGRSPSAERARSRLAGVLVYAFLCEQVLGHRPIELRLMYLRDQVVLVERPNEQSMRGLRQRARAVWAAIERACSEEDFRPSPSPLCRHCAFQTACPAFGGSLPDTTGVEHLLAEPRRRLAEVATPDRSLRDAPAAQIEPPWTASAGVETSVA